TLFRSALQRKLDRLDGAGDVRDVERRGALGRLDRRSRDRAADAPGVVEAAPEDRVVLERLRDVDVRSLFVGVARGVDVPRGTVQEDGRGAGVDGGERRAQRRDVVRGEEQVRVVERD